VENTRIFPRRKLPTSLLQQAAQKCSNAVILSIYGQTSATHNMHDINDLTVYVMQSSSEGSAFKFTSNYRLFLRYAQDRLPAPQNDSSPGFFRKLLGLPS